MEFLKFNVSVLNPHRNLAFVLGKLVPVFGGEFEGFVDLAERLRVG